MVRLIKPPNNASGESLSFKDQNSDLDQNLDLVEKIETEANLDPGSKNCQKKKELINGTSSRHANNAESLPFIAEEVYNNQKTASEDMIKNGKKDDKKYDWKKISKSNIDEEDDQIFDPTKSPLQNINRDNTNRHEARSYPDGSLVANLCGTSEKLKQKSKVSDTTKSYQTLNNQKITEEVDENDGPTYLLPNYSTINGTTKAPVCLTDQNQEKKISAEDPKSMLNNSSADKSTNTKNKSKKQNLKNFINNNLDDKEPEKPDPIAASDNNLPNSSLQNAIDTSDKRSDMTTLCFDRPNFPDKTVNEKNGVLKLNIPTKFYDNYLRSIDSALKETKKKQKNNNEETDKSFSDKPIEKVSNNYRHLADCSANLHQNKSEEKKVVDLETEEPKMTLENFINNKINTLQIFKRLSSADENMSENLLDLESRKEKSKSISPYFIQNQDNEVETEDESDIDLDVVTTDTKIQDTATLSDEETIILFYKKNQESTTNKNFKEENPFIKVRVLRKYYNRYIVEKKNEDPEYKDQNKINSNAVKTVLADARIPDATTVSDKRTITLSCNEDQENTTNESCSEENAFLEVKLLRKHYNSYIAAKKVEEQIKKDSDAIKTVFTDDKIQDATPPSNKDQETITFFYRKHQENTANTDCKEENAYLNVRVLRKYYNSYIAANKTKDQIKRDSDAIKTDTKIQDAKTLSDEETITIFVKKHQGSTTNGNCKKKNVFPNVKVLWEYYKNYIVEKKNTHVRDQNKIKEDASSEDILLQKYFSNNIADKIIENALATDQNNIDFDVATTDNEIQDVTAPDEETISFFFKKNDKSTTDESCKEENAFLKGTVLRKYYNTYIAAKKIKDSNEKDSDDFNIDTKIQDDTALSDQNLETITLSLRKHQHDIGKKEKEFLEITFLRKYYKSYIAAKKIEEQPKKDSDTFKIGKIRYPQVSKMVNKNKTTIEDIKMNKFLNGIEDTCTSAVLDHPSLVFNTIYNDSSDDEKAEETEDDEEEEKSTNNMTNEIDNNFNKYKTDNKIRDATAQSGEEIIYFFYKKPHQSTTDKNCKEENAVLEGTVLRKYYNTYIAAKKIKDSNEKDSDDFNIDTKIQDDTALSDQNLETITLYLSNHQKDAMAETCKEENEFLKIRALRKYYNSYIADKNRRTTEDINVNTFLNRIEDEKLEKHTNNMTNKSDNSFNQYKPEIDVESGKAVIETKNADKAENPASNNIEKTEEIVEIPDSLVGTNSTSSSPLNKKGEKSNTHDQKMKQLIEVPQINQSSNEDLGIPLKSLIDNTNTILDKLELREPEENGYKEKIETMKTLMTVTKDLLNVLKKLIVVFNKHM